MALQICPKCGKEACTWSIDEEVSKFTQWYCSECGYVAFEDESREAVCDHGSKLGGALIKDEEGFHRWCARCSRFESVDETF